MDRDVLHPAGREREWGESFYFDLYDQENDLGMFMALELEPNADQRSASCFVLMPDGSLVGTMDRAPFANGELDVRSLRFEGFEEEKRWKLTFNGHMSKMSGGEPQPVPVSFSLLFEALNPLFDHRESAGQGEHGPKSGRDERLESFGRVEGNLTIDSETLRVSGLGGREHSWSVRDRNAPKLRIRLTAEFSEALAFSVTKIFLDEGEASAGFVYLDGRNLPIVKADVRTTLDKDGTPLSIRIDVQDKFGGKHQASGAVLREALISLPGDDGKSVAIMHEALVEFKFRGKKGYGMAEYLVRKG